VGGAFTAASGGFDGEEAIAVEAKTLSNDAGSKYFWRKLQGLLRR